MRLHQGLHLAEELAQVGHAAATAQPSPPKSCSNGVPLNGFWLVRSASSGSRLVAHGVQRYSADTYARPMTQAETHPAVRLVDLRETRSTSTEVVAALDDDAAGGLTLFVGRVRDHDRGTGRRRARLLRASHRADTAARGLRPGRRGVRRARARRRAPRRQPRRSATSRSSSRPPPPTAATRSTASRALIDTLKAEVPIWKHQRFERRRRRVGRHALARLTCVRRMPTLASWRSCSGSCRRSSSPSWRCCGSAGWGARAAARSTATSPYAASRRPCEKDHRTTQPHATRARRRDRSTGIAVRPSRVGRLCEPDPSQRVVARV